VKEFCKSFNIWRIYRQE